MLKFKNIQEEQVEVAEDRAEDGGPGHRGEDLAAPGASHARGLHLRPGRAQRVGPGPPHAQEAARRGHHHQVGHHHKFPSSMSLLYPLYCS